MRATKAIPIGTWANLPEEQQNLLYWFSCYMADEKLTQTEAARRIGYDVGNLGKVLKNTYTGNMDNVCNAIAAHKEIALERSRIVPHAETVDTPIAQLIYGGLNHAMANHSVVPIIGESRTGKTVAAEKWASPFRHKGTVVFVTAPPLGGPTGLLRAICREVHIFRNMSSDHMLDTLRERFNPNMMLIIDEMHQALPVSKESKPKALDAVRYIHDKTQCGLALISTHRYDQILSGSTYMYEQIIGRSGGYPVYLPSEIDVESVRPIVEQYIPAPSARTMKACLKMANNSGRLGLMVETLKAASVLAHEEGRELDEKAVLDTVSLRKFMIKRARFSPLKK